MWIFLRIFFLYSEAFTSRRAITSFMVHSGRKTKFRIAFVCVYVFFRFSFFMFVNPLAPVFQLSADGRVAQSLYALHI